MAYVYALINKNTLKHIYDKKKVSIEYLKKKTHTTEEKLSKWMDVNDSELPTIRQAKTLAAALHIPFAGLYMNPEDIPIKQIPKCTNYRKLISSIYDDSVLNLAILDILQEREFLINTNDELGLSIPFFQPNTPNSDNPIIWAREIRKHFDLNLDEQFELTSSRKLYIYLRNKIEEKGVFIQSFIGVPTEIARGLAIYEKTLPIIGINADDRYPAKSFSIIHELVHLYKRASSLCNEMNNEENTPKEEVFCNAVAGELLVPKIELTKVLKNGKYSSPIKIIEIERLSKLFSVSKEVIIRRLLEIKEIDINRYNSLADKFNKDYEKQKEKERIARKNGKKNSFRINVSRNIIDVTSSSVCSTLRYGYAEDYFSKRDIAMHLDISQRHVDNFFKEVSTWNK